MQCSEIRVSFDGFVEASRWKGLIILRGNFDYFKKFLKKKKNREKERKKIKKILSSLRSFPCRRRTLTRAYSLRLASRCRVGLYISTGAYRLYNSTGAYRLYISTGAYCLHISTGAYRLYISLQEPIFPP